MYILPGSQKDTQNDANIYNIYTHTHVSNLQDSYNLHVARNYRTGSESAGNRDPES